MPTPAKQMPARRPRVFRGGTSIANETLQIALAEALDYIASVDVADADQRRKGDNILKRGGKLLAELRGEGPRHV